MKALALVVANFINKDQRGFSKHFSLYTVEVKAAIQPIIMVADLTNFSIWWYHCYQQIKKRKFQSISQIRDIHVIYALVIIFICRLKSVLSSLQPIRLINRAEWKTSKSEMLKFSGRLWTTSPSWYQNSFRNHDRTIILLRNWANRNYRTRCTPPETCVLACTHRKISWTFRANH